jgi:hypothetical protein
VQRTTQRLLSITLTTIVLVAAASATRAEEAESESELKRNHAVIFAGWTEGEVSEVGIKQDPRFTLGLGYERRLSRLVGVGGVLEAVVDGDREALFLAPVFFHFGRAKLIAGPGAQRLRDPAETQFVARFAFEYDFAVKSIVLTPMVALDLAAGDRFTVVGLDIGWEF